MAFNNEVTVTINGEVVENIAPGLPTIDALDETLDSGTLIIAPTKRRDRYPVYSEVFITTVSNGVTETKYFYVSEDGVDTVCKDPVLYSHTVQLIEPTKRLEGIPCDNLTFVKPSAANSYPTALNGNATIYDVVMRIRECAQLRTENSTRKYPFELTDAVTIAYLKSITAPQFFLNAGNVKDALNQVFKYINGTARLKTFTELTVDFFNDYKDLITTDGAQDYAESQSIENYSTALISNIANATGDVGDRQSLVNFPSPKNWLTFRPQRDEGILTTDNSVCKTPSPIYQIEKVVFWAPISRSSTRINFEMDITQFVVEKSVFDTLPQKTEYRRKLVSSSEDGNLYAFEITKPGQDSTLVYDYMGTEIYGIFNNYRGIPFTYNALDFIIGYLYSQAVPFDGQSILEPWEYARLQGGRYGDVAYQIDYITTVDTRAEVQRLDLTDFKVYSTQQINQASNLVNTTAFGDSMRGLIERLGNPEKIATKLFRYNSDVPKIGDYTEDGYVVTTLQKSLYNDYVVAVLGMTKNFNRRSQFVDVDSEVRQYVIPAVGESLTRHSNYGEFIYLDIGENTQIQSDVNSIVQPGTILPLIIQFISQKFSADFAINPNLANLIFYNKNKSVISNIMTSAYSHGFANSLVFSFGFNDNRSAGESTSTQYVVEERQVAKIIGYTDSDGAAAYLDINLVNHWVDDGSFNTASTLGRQFPTWTSAMDITDMASIATVNKFKLFKSPAEISKFTIQIHYLPLPQYAANMILGVGLTSESSLTQIYPAGITRNIAVYTVNDRFQKWENKFVRGTKIGNITEGSTADGGKVNLPNIPAGKSWCIGNEDTKSLYLAYNPEPNEVPPKTIRFVRKINRI